MTVNVTVIQMEKDVLHEARLTLITSDQRKGQALMNALRKLQPELYEIITGTLDDCFYDDSKITRTFEALGFNHKIF